MPAAVCSECGGKLSNPQAKTCSPAHRNQRARRIKRQRKEHARLAQEAWTLPEHLRPVSDAVHKGAKDVGHEVLKEEIRPLVREAITEDVMRGIGKLVTLTPRMVELIEEDMESKDPAVRQKAYTLLARYTLGNASVAPAPAEQQPAPMQVFFEMPRPGGTEAPAVDAEATEERECAECHELKPTPAFVGNSDRCMTCHETIQAKVRERMSR